MKVIITEKIKDNNCYDTMIEHIMPNVISVDFDFTTNTWIFVRMEQNTKKIRECINFNEIVSIKCMEEEKQ